MNKIEVKVLNPMSVQEACFNLLVACKLTQKGEKIKSIDDFENLCDFDKLSDKVIYNLCKMEHRTVQSMNMISIIVIGASRRFLSQITRHHEANFISASLQYSDYSGEADFVIPHSFLNNKYLKNLYLKHCYDGMVLYETMKSNGVDTDEAGYNTSQGLRNVLIISATPFVWKHMISQRVCRRNTEETRYIMLKCWDELYELSPSMFHKDFTGPMCMGRKCREGRMSCGHPYGCEQPSSILKEEFGDLE